MSDLGKLFDLECNAANELFDRREREMLEHGYRKPGVESERMTGLDVCVHSPRCRVIERYLRATITIPGGSIEAGMQRTRGEPLTLLRAELARIIADEVLTLNGDDVDDESAGRLIDAIEERISETWPARAWFVEVWQADEAVCQVYAPYGMPRRR